PWREEYLGDTIAASRAVFATLASLGTPQPYIGASQGTPEQLALFARMTNGPLATAGDVTWNGVRQRLARAIARVQGKFAEVAVPVSIVVWVVLIVVGAVRRRWHVANVLCAALLAAIVTRVVLLG